MPDRKSFFLLMYTPEYIYIYWYGRASQSHNLIGLLCRHIYNTCNHKNTDETTVGYCSSCSVAMVAMVAERRQPELLAHIGPMICMICVIDSPYSS